jgi:tRNA:m4X modification enzyme
MKKHVKKCNKVKLQQALEAADYYKPRVNVLRPTAAQRPSKPEWTDEDCKEVILVVERLYAKATSDYQMATGEVPDWSLTKDVVATEMRHQLQGRHITSFLESSRLLDPQYLYIEYGAGKGGLSRAISDHMTGNSKHLLLECESRRHKHDRQVDTHMTRIRINIADFDTETHCQGQAIVGVAKHLCGGATDLSLVSMTKPLVDCRGLGLATCCHHLCTLDTYFGLDYMTAIGVDEPTLLKVFRCTSWGVSGAIRLNESLIDTVERTRIGLMAKRVIDIGRIMKLKEHFDDVRLSKYCESEVSPENVLLLAVSPRKPSVVDRESS